MSFIVYKHTSTITIKSYIGVTGIGLKERFDQHCWDAGRSDQGRKFQRAIRKYGKEAWKSEILHTVEIFEEALALEIFEIAKWDSFKNGYNSTIGGEGASGFKHPKEAIAKRSGENHVQAKAYIVTFPDGSEIEIPSLTQFCKERGLDHRKAHMTTWNRGRRHKGFRFRLVGEEAVLFQPRPRGVRLTSEQRAEIARRLIAGEKARSLSEEFDVSDVTICSIKRKATAGDSLSHKIGGLFIVTHPDGYEEEVRNLNLWCRHHNISRSSAHLCCKRPGTPHKGFLFRRLGDEIVNPPKPVRHLTESEKADLQLKARQGVRPAELAKIFGITIAGACYHADKVGQPHRGSRARAKL